MLLQAESFKLNNRLLNVTLAVSREKAEELTKKRKEAKKEDNKDGRNLWLAREGCELQQNYQILHYVQVSLFIDCKIMIATK